MRALITYATALSVRTVASVALPGLTSAAVAAAVNGGHGPAFVALIACVAVLAAGDVLSSVSATNAVTRSTAAHRRRLVGRLLLAENRPETGDAVTRVVHAASDAAAFPVAVVSAVIALAGAAAAAVLLWCTDALTGAAFTLAVPLVALAARGPLRGLGAAQKDYLHAQSRISSRLLAVLGGARTVRASNTVDLETERVLGPLAALSAAGRVGWRHQRSLVFRVRLASALVEVVTLVVAGVSVAGGRIAAPALIAVVGFITLALAGIEQVDTVAELVVAAASRARVREVLDGKVIAPRGGPLPAGDLDVRWEGVYVGGLRDVHLHLPAGTSLALVGPSGSGKSRLAATVGGLLRPDRGRILLAGRNVADLDVRTTDVGYAFDAPALLGATVEDVIAWPDLPGTVDVRGAARTARADAFVRHLPDGYLTPIAQTPLSGGERQRLGLARAFAHPSRILVIDDAASGLDAATAADIRSAIADGTTGRTRLITTHSADTAAACDRVAWLDAGRVRAVGTHAALWDDPDYRALFGARHAVVMA